MINRLRSPFTLLFALALACLSAAIAPPFLLQCAEVVSSIFVKLLRLISLPMLFLSLVSTISSMESFQAMRSIGKKVIFYTLMTTLCAASIALALFVWISPAMPHSSEGTLDLTQDYMSSFLQIIPDNVLGAFIEGNVLGILFFAISFSLAILSLPSKEKELLHSFFRSLFSAFLIVTDYILLMMPFGVWAFSTLLFVQWRDTEVLSHLLSYLFCIVSANLVQGLLVLPLFLYWKGISPRRAFRAMAPALTLAFFSKSSTATLPLSLRSAKERLKVRPAVADFTLPLCSAINMNACAAFILITVLFVALSEGMIISPLGMLSWVFISTIAAVGNAGVPMGCYFLASAFLASMGLPLELLGLILPVYALIDMLETALNVWSDSCVCAVVDVELKREEDLLNFSRFPRGKSRNSKS